jgi:hypothetical protein
MGAIDVRYRSAERHLEALELDAREEPWKAAAREAEGVYHYERALGMVISLFDIVAELNKSWRDAVYRAAEPFDRQKESFIKHLIARWRDLANAFMRTADFHERGYEIERAAELQRCRDTAEETLAKWVSPRPSASPAMHIDDVSEDEADALRDVLDAPPGSPGKLKIKPQSLPQGDPSLLR